MAIAVVFCAILAIYAGMVDSATPHQAPAPAVDCPSLFINLVDCLTFVTNGSTVSKPQGTCCDGLNTVLKTDAKCLCEGFKSSAQLGVSLNITKALTLPAVCRLSSPPVSECGLDIGASPATSPSSVALPPGMVAWGPAPGTGGVTEVVTPAPAPGKTGSASVSAISTISVILAIFVALVSLF